MLAAFCTYSPAKPLTGSRNLTRVPGPPQWTLNETAAGTGGTSVPWSNEFGIVKKSDTSTLLALINAAPLPALTWTLPSGSGTVQNRPDSAMPGLKSCSWLLKLLKSGAPGPSKRSLR